MNDGFTHGQNRFRYFFRSEVPGYLLAPVFVYYQLSEEI